ncbi:unnamed protein product [Ectocarpus sp. 12 AP-2014]
MASTDKDALLALFHATRGREWTNNDKWNTETDISLWHGVTVNEGRVVQPDLSSNNLQGYIPPELGKLGALTQLNFRTNKLSGSIPQELGKLAALQKLSLRNNKLSGPIPLQLGNLGALGSLDLSSNELDGPIPPELGALSELKKLNLYGNQLTGSIPKELGDLSKLEILGLYDNKLTGHIPDALGALSELKDLGLHGNRLKGPIPPVLGNLGELAKLSLRENGLTGYIPSQLGNLSALEILGLSYNKLNGKIPESLGQLGNLQLLYLDNNTLIGEIPTSLGQLSKLKGLFLQKNKLSGTIPKEMGNLTALTRLWLNGNNLEGTIPEELGKLTALTYLRLNVNSLEGSIPRELGALTKLETLLLYNNQLTGPIPPELGNLGALVKLSLQENELTGAIPAALGALSVLKELVLGANQLTEIPPEVLKLCRGRLSQPIWNENPWSRPPSTVLESGFESALGWWEDVKRFGEGKSNKLKMVLVGLAEAGKTTIVRHFTKKSVPKQSDRTVGIEITNWRPADNVPLQISVWDFAGQADYYSSHQLFLTKGALFLLVVDLHAFSKEMGSGVDNFTDPRRRIYWWLEMLHMRVPGAAIALVGSHVDSMEKEGVDAELACTRLHTVVSKFIDDKAENAFKGKSNCCDTESTTTMEVDHLRDGQQAFPLGGSLAQRSGPSKISAEPLVLHGHVFKVSLDPDSVLELLQWIVKAASGRGCPSGFHFPAVDQTVPKAWIEAYDAMDVLKERRPCVLWSEAVEKFRNLMSGSLPDAGTVLLRAMQHREAEGGALLSLADPSAPVAADMLHLDPSWLIELVRRLVDHNLMDEKKQGTVEQGLRKYARQHRLHAGPLFDMHGVYCKSGRLNEAYLRFLWMHRKTEAPGTEVKLTDPEFQTIVSTMIRLFVMYTARGADDLVVPARLPEYGDQRMLAPDTISDIVMTMQCSFGHVYPPPGIVGRFLAWSAQQVAAYEKCWQHGAFFSYKYQYARYDVFLYESCFEEPHDDGTVSVLAGLTLGIQGPPPRAADILAELKESLENLVSDSAFGYPGLAGLMYFRPAKKSKSCQLLGLRAVVDNLDNAADRVEVAAGRAEVAAGRSEVAAGSLEETARKLGGIVNQLLEQELFGASDEHSGEYPRLVLVRPELETKDGGTHERIQHAGWDRWMKNLNDVGFHHKFRLHFLCEHDLSEVPCGLDGRGFPIDQLKDWVKQCLPLMQASLWMLRVAVGTVSNVDLPLNEVLGAFVQATGAELLNSMSKVPDTINSGSLPVFGEGATEEETKRFTNLRGKAYKALCEFMRQKELSPPQRLSGCLPCGCPTIVNWRDGMVQVGQAWVLKTNEEAYRRQHGGAPAAAQAPA